MVDKISELPAAATLDGTEILPITQGTGGSQETRQLSLRTIRRRHTGFIASRQWNIFGSANCVIGTAAAFPVADVAHLYPFICADDSIDWIGIAQRITATGAGSAFKSALFAQDPATLKPSTLLAKDDTGVSTASSAVITTSTWVAPYRPLAGKVYFAALKATGTMPTTLNFANTNSLMQWLLGAAIGGSAGGTFQGLSIAHPYATPWADMNPADSYTNLSGAQPLPFIVT